MSELIYCRISTRVEYSGWRNSYVSGNSYTDFLTEEQMYDLCYTSTFGWDLAEKQLSKSYNIAISRTRKDKIRVKSYDWDVYRTIVQNKRNEDREFTIISETYPIDNWSIKEILQHSKGEKAIEFLKQHGLTTCPFQQ